MGCIDMYVSWIIIESQMLELFLTSGVSLFCEGSMGNNPIIDSQATFARAGARIAPPPRPEEGNVMWAYPRYGQGMQMGSLCYESTCRVRIGKDKVYGL